MVPHILVHLQFDAIFHIDINNRSHLTTLPQPARMSVTMGLLLFRVTAQPLQPNYIQIRPDAQWQWGREDLVWMEVGVKFL